jgi:hypothetical protein
LQAFATAVPETPKSEAIWEIGLDQTISNSSCREIVVLLSGINSQPIEKASAASILPPLTIR